MTTNPITYDFIAEQMESKYFLRMSDSHMNWIKDISGPNFLLIKGEDKDPDNVKGILRPDGSFTTYITKQELMSDYQVNRILRHVGIEAAVLRLAANKETHFGLVPRKNDLQTVSETLEIKDGDVRLEGIYMGKNRDDMSPDNLCMGCAVPEEFKPKELPKVPRKIIAQLRAHVQNQFKLAQIADKVSGNVTQRHELYHLAPDNQTKKAFGQGNLQIRGKMMTTTDMEFWRFARAHFTVTGLIDSCRSDFYNAAGVRPQPVAEPLPFVPKNADDI